MKEIFFFFFYDLLGKAGMVTKPKGAAHILKKCEWSMISHRSLTKLSLIPALLCQAALTRIVWFNWRLHRSQTPVACSHKLACFFVRLLFLSHPSGLNPSSWHLNAPHSWGVSERRKWMKVNEYHFALCQQSRCFRPPTASSRAAHWPSKNNSVVMQYWRECVNIYQYKTGPKLVKLAVFSYFGLSWRITYRSEG